MIESLVRGALKQRLIVAVVAVVLFFFGLDAARKLSVDAFPDVTNVQVQIATEAPGRSPEEVERFATVPLEVAMTGLPGLEEMRSLNKPGLSLITLVFNDKTDVYFAASWSWNVCSKWARACRRALRRCSDRYRPAWARSTNTRWSGPMMATGR